MKHITKYKTLDMLKPIKLYINGAWVDVLPVYREGTNFVVKNIDKRYCPLIKYQVVDLYWHFTVSEGRQIKNVDGRVSYIDQVKFILRSVI